MDDNGTAIGLKDTDDCYTRVINAIRDNISPDITMFIKYELDDEEHIIRIIVSEGATKPYFLKAKGMRSEGVYVRQGASSVPASIDKIRQMIKLSENDTHKHAIRILQISFIA